jgi:hypothetical protein
MISGGVPEALPMRASQGKPLSIGHPEFEDFESVLESLPKGRAA